MALAIAVSSAVRHVGGTCWLQSGPAQPSVQSHWPSAHTPCPLHRLRSLQALMGWCLSLMQARQHSAGATGSISPSPKRLRDVHTLVRTPAAALLALSAATCLPASLHSSNCNAPCWLCWLLVAS